MRSTKSSTRQRRWTRVSAILTILLLSITILSATPMVIASGEHPDREIETRFDFTFDVKGFISEFSIWLTFPEPLDTSFAEMQIEVHHGRDVWLVSEGSFPYSRIWTNDSRTLEISSRGIDLSGKDVGIINIRISTPLMLEEGGFYWEDHDDIELSFGEQDFRFGLGYGIIGTLAGFCLPSILLMIILIVIEISLRSFMRRKKRNEIDASTTETLLQLIDRSEIWMKRRMRYLLVISSLLLIMFAFSFLLATINVFFAMTVVLMGVLFIFPWLVLISASIMFFLIRKEDIYWKERLKQVRKRQIEFMKGLEKE